MTWFANYDTLSMDKQSSRACFEKFISTDPDHSVFYFHVSQNKCVYLIVYIDDIVITKNDQEKLSHLKEHLFHFSNQGLGFYCHVSE